MRELTVTLCLDRHGEPLVTLESPLGFGQDMAPESLRSLAAALLDIADLADHQPRGKHYRQVSKTIKY